MINNNEDHQIAGSKSEQLRDLLPKIFYESGDLDPSPLESLALELIEDIVHAIRRLS